MNIMICSDLHWDNDFAPEAPAPRINHNTRSQSASTTTANPSDWLRQNTVFRSLIESPALKSLTTDDLMFVAGDVADGSIDIQACLTALRAHTDATIVGVMGNHDYFNETLSPLTVDRIQAELPERVFLLENQAIELNGIRVLGCTLWTNPRVDEQEAGQTILPEYAQVDNQEGQLLCVADTVATHQASVAWLNMELAKPFNGKTVVLTHHAPSFISQHDRHRFSELSAFFCVNLEDLIFKHQPHLWIHGHLHDPVDYELDNTRIVSAPLGYPDERSGDFCPKLIEV